MCYQDFSAEARNLAVLECICCFNCNDTPCEGSLNWDNRCERNGCSCDTDEDDDV